MKGKGKEAVPSHLQIHDDDAIITFDHADPERHAKPPKGARSLYYSQHKSEFKDVKGGGAEVNKARKKAFDALPEAEKEALAEEVRQQQAEAEARREAPVPDSVLLE